jgi:RNase H-like domain found in reverse transcriptase
MDVEKTAAISKWPIPANLRDVQSFLGFANFYRRFIISFSEIVLPLTRLTRKDTPFVWGEKQQHAFEALKAMFSEAPILIHFDPNNPIVVETDASDYAIAAIISQITPSNGDIHPIAFYSRGMAPAEMNYEIYDKELLAIFCAFKQWRNYLEGGSHVILVLSDHKNLEYFATTKQLTQ